MVASSLQLLNNLIVISWVAHNSHSVVVLGRGPKEGHSSNVDVLYSISDGYVRLGHRLDERVKVADHDTYHVKLLTLHVSLVRVC